MSPFPGSASQVSHDWRWSCLCSPPPSALGCSMGNSERTWAEGSLQQQPLLLARLFSVLPVSLQPQHLALVFLLYSLIWGTKQSWQTGAFATWKEKRFLSLSYLCHRLLEHIWMHPSPLRASFPKLLVSRNNYFLKSLLIYFVIWVRDHFWLFLQTVPNTPQPSLIDRLYALTVMQFNIQHLSPTS